jgi:hypothetical protein
MRNYSYWWAAALVVIGAGCGSGQTKSRPTTKEPPAAARAGDQMCPMAQMTGAKVVASDTDNGVAIAFTTTGDVADLRARVRRMAEMHEHMAAMHQEHAMGGGSGDMHPGMGSGGDMHGEMMHMPMMTARVTVEDIPDGARLVFVPSDPSQLPALRAQAREHAAMMAKGECPMMGAQPPPDDDHTQHHPSGT